MRTQRAVAAAAQRCATSTYREPQHTTSCAQGGSVFRLDNPVFKGGRESWDRAGRGGGTRPIDWSCSISCGQTLSPLLGVVRFHPALCAVLPFQVKDINSSFYRRYKTLLCFWRRTNIHTHLLLSEGDSSSTLLISLGFFSLGTHPLPSPSKEVEKMTQVLKYRGC